MPRIDPKECIDMKFYTNKISTGRSAGFGAFVQKLAESNAALSKTASTEAVTKEANASNFGDKKAPPFGKKDEAKKPEGAVEAKPEAEEKEATAEKEVKVAEKGDCKSKDGECHVKMQEMDPVGGTNTGKPEGEKKKESEAKAEVKEAGKKPVIVTKKVKVEEIKGKPVGKKASNDEVPAENKGVTHKVDECCGAPSSKGDDGSEGEKKAEKSDKAEKKEASSPAYVKIANLDSKTKNEWKTYWKKLYPAAYVEAMFADK
jgi:hypothetical protein